MAVKTNIVCVCVLCYDITQPGRWVPMSVGIQSLEGKFTKNWRPLIRLQFAEISKGRMQIIQ